MMHFVLVDCIVYRSALVIIFPVVQVVNLGLLRMISNDVSMHAEWVYQTCGSLVHGDFASTMRHANQRVALACRSDPVPYLGSGYVSKCLLILD